eukprot:4902325-Prymnesium_polylepis.2
MLLLTAVRDAARDLIAAAAAADSRAQDAAKAAAALVDEVEAVLMTRTRIGAAPGNSAALGSQAGLESLPDAWRVRLVPSREDRLPFCSLESGARS